MSAIGEDFDPTKPVTPPLADKMHEQVLELSGSDLAAGKLGLDMQLQRLKKGFMGKE